MKRKKKKEILRKIKLKHACELFISFFFVDHALFWCGASVLFIFRGLASFIIFPTPFLKMTLDKREPH